MSAGGAGAPAAPAVEVFPIERLREFSTRVLEWCGVPDEDARLAADVLATADLRGIDTHGVARLAQYVEMFQRGLINPRPQLRVVRETPSTARVDGDNGLGLVVGPRSVRIAMDKADAVGSGSVAVGNSNHFGIGEYYALQGLPRDMIVWAMTNSPPQVAPLWGAEKMLGTNPMAIAFPGGEEPAVVGEERHLHVLAHGERGEGLGDLERPADSEPPDPPRRPAGDVGAQRHHAAGVGADLAHQHVEAGRLAGPVRADQRHQLARRHGERHAVHGAHAAEALGEPVRLQDRRHAGSSAPLARDSRSRAKPAIPCGKARTRPMMVRPSSRRQAPRRESALSSRLKAAAPATGPSSAPTPPSSTIISASNERAMLISSGNTLPFE